MKLYFDLKKEEAEGYLAFEQTVKPDQISQQDFVKTIFFKGVDALNAEFREVAQAYAKEHGEQLKEEGMDPDQVVANLGGDFEDSQTEEVNTDEKVTS